VCPGIPMRFCTPLRSVHATERSAAHLGCELSCREATVRWLKDGVDVTADPRYAVLREGKRAELVLDDCRLDDEGEFSVVCTQEHDSTSYVSSASLTVQGTSVRVCVCVCVCYAQFRAVIYCG